MLTIRLDLVPRLRMCGAVPLLPLYVYMDSTGTTNLTLPFTFKKLMFLSCLWGRGKCFETKFLEVSIVEETAHSIKVTCT